MRAYVVSRKQGCIRTQTDHGADAHLLYQLRAPGQNRENIYFELFQKSAVLARLGAMGEHLD